MNNITKGPVKVDHSMSGSYVQTDCKEGYFIAGCMDAWENNKDNAEFIAECYNLAHETGKTPKELAEDSDKYKTDAVRFSNICASKEEKLQSLYKRVKELEESEMDLKNRVDSCRHYLMGVQPGDITVEHALVSLGYNENGFDI